MILFSKSNLDVRLLLVGTPDFIIAFSLVFTIPLGAIASGSCCVFMSRPCCFVSGLDKIFASGFGWII